MKGFTIKDSVTNSYVGPIMINGLVFFYKKPSVYASKTTMEKLIVKLIEKYPLLENRLVIEEDFNEWEKRLF